MRTTLKLRFTFSPWFRQLARLALWGLLASTTPSWAQVDEATAELLMRKSGLWQQLDGLGDQVRAGFQAHAVRAWQPPSGAETERLNRVISGAFAVDRLRRVALQSLARHADPAQVAAVRSWSSSAVGEGMTRLEEAASASPTDQTEVLREGAQLLENLPSVRRAQLNEMLEASRAAEFTVETLISIVMAIQQGVQAAQPGATLVPTATLRAAMEAQRAVMLQNYSVLFMASFARTYRAVPSADLSQYVAFLKSDAGRHFNGVALAALAAALTDASAAFGHGLPATKDAANS